MPEKRCHYDVLQIERDADLTTIKKSHRKLARQYHPDKNLGDESAAQEFLLIQQAYECLSDSSERKWYDEHREMILRGDDSGGGLSGEGGDGAAPSYVFDVTSFHFTGCYQGYGDGKGGFFQVYEDVFSNIMTGEQDGFISEGNIDEAEMCNHHLYNTNFGNSKTPHSDVSHFYSSWESFSSCLSFAWADKYDPRDADSRWVRRRIEEDNKKSRKVAKRKRNDDVQALVTFVKKHDPRVKRAKELAYQAKVEKERLQKEEMERKKVENAAAREQWLEERRREMEEAEQQDLDAGRIRLADLDDSDEEYGGKKGRRKKKNKKKKNWVESSSEEEKEEEQAIEESFRDEVNEDSELIQEPPQESRLLNNEEEEASILDELDQDEVDAKLQEEEELQYYEETESEEESEPEIWKCEICKKTFKSKAQYENHLKSKKHRDMVKKKGKSKK